mgnify:CR=1 FL=1
MLILLINNEVKNTTMADEESKESVIQFLESQGYTVLERNIPVSIGDIYDHITGTFSTPLRGSWIISKRAFKNRFPRAKWNYASMNKDSNPLLFDMLETWTVSSQIDLKNEETVYSVNALTFENIPLEARLTAEEADAILVPPAGPGEE